MSFGFVVSVMMSTLTLMPSDVVAGDYGVELEYITSLKLPVYSEAGGRQWRFDSGAVNSMALDQEAGILYVVGSVTIQYINVSNPSRLVIIGHTSLPDVTLYDVRTCGNYVFATYTTSSNKSGLLVARGYWVGYNFPLLLQTIIYGEPEPVSLAVTSDCATAVVAVSGKASWDGEKFVDPHAAVLAVDLTPVLSGQTADIDADAVTVLDFGAFNDMTGELVKQGLHFPMEGRVGGLSQDMDPTDVTIDNIEKQAYVALRVNNAIAVIDLVSKNISRVVPLGLKDWADLDIDLSDKDGVHFQRQPIYSMYQPGAICIVRHSGGSYLLTANTGGKRDYSHIIQWKEDITGKELIEEDLVGTSVESELRAALHDDYQMGNLHFTKHNGLNDVPSSKMSKFVIFGGRSISVRPLSDLGLLTYDSGSDLELRVSQRSPEIFNLPARKGFNSLSRDRDLTSVTTGPQPTAVATGTLGALTLVAVGLGSPGGVLLYSMVRGDLPDSTPPSFQSYWPGVEERPLNRTWDQLYARGALDGIRVSDMIFVPSHISNQGFPLLLVAGAKSETVSVLKVKGVGDIPYRNSVEACRGMDKAAVLLSMLITTLTLFHGPLPVHAWDPL